MKITTTVLALLTTLLLSGCGDRRAPVELEPVREELAKPGLATPLSSAARFGYNPSSDDAAARAHASVGILPATPHPTASGSLHWSAPAGWIEAPPRSMREVTFFLDESRSAECYISVLGGGAGGDAANLNRWRGQMGLPTLDAAQLAALPRTRCLESEAPLLIAEGAYRGMGGGAGTPGSLFVGTMAPWGTQTLFVRMVGPKALVEPHVDAFKSFCASIHAGSDHGDGGAHD
ncbi:MAG: hypothetical protein HQ523_07740 [Lentisphaerae bacterium]|nr:hypothetical protein [Lentisphaerota bacterium]